MSDASIYMAAAEHLCLWGISLLVLQIESLMSVPGQCSAALQIHQPRGAIVQVIKKAGGSTHWSDKHAAYDLVQGANGNAIDDFCALLPSLRFVPLTLGLCLGYFLLLQSVLAMAAA